MAIYIKRSCPNCKFVFDNWALNYRKLGCPISTCPKCNTPIRSDHINEWELLSILKKIEFFIALFYTSFAFSIWSVLGMYLLSQIGYKEFFWQDNAPTINVAVVLGIVTVIIFIIRSHKFINSIKDSIERMRNVNYRKYLQSFGIIDTLPEITICNYCKNEVELNSRERILKEFICPHCNKRNS